MVTEILDPCVLAAAGDAFNFPIFTAASVSAAPSSVVRNLLLHVWRTPGINTMLRSAIACGPATLQNRVERERQRVRKDELDAQIRNRTRLLPELLEFRTLISRGLRDLSTRHGRESLGDYLEFGVYNGTSLTCMYQELQALGLDHIRLFGFDSFQGFPPTAADEDEGRWQPGRCHSPLEFTTAVLEAEGVDLSRATLVPGWFSNTLNEVTRRTHKIAKASVIMIDCDLYSSTKEALRFCLPLIGHEALVLFDEWTISRIPDKNMGEKRAFQEFLEEHPTFSAIPYGQYAKRSQAFMVSRSA
jgi:O-methyltransferase